TSGEQAPVPAWPAHNPDSPNNNAEQEPNGFLPIPDVAAGSIELPTRPISNAHRYGRIRRSIFYHALPLTGSRRQRTTARALKLDQAVEQLETNLLFVGCSVQSH